MEPVNLQFKYMSKPFPFHAKVKVLKQKFPLQNIIVQGKDHLVKKDQYGGIT